MPRKPAVFLSALVLASLGLTACGSNSDSPGDDATTPPAAHEETTTQEGRTTPAADAEDAVEEPTDTTEDTDDETADTAAETADPGPAPDGAVIPAAAVAKPPETIAQFTLMDGEGPAHIYSTDSPSAMVALDGNVLSSPYETLAEYIETDNTPAGTGSCGTDEAGTSITCYQRVEDGVVTLTASPKEMRLADMVVFVNQYAEQAGAA